MKVKCKGNAEASHFETHKLPLLVLLLSLPHIVWYATITMHKTAQYHIIYFIKATKQKVSYREKLNNAANSIR